MQELLHACQKCISGLLADEAKATPGPWTVSDDGYSSVVIECVGKVRGGWKTVCELQGDSAEACEHNPTTICTSRNMHRPMLEYLRDELDICATSSGPIERFAHGTKVFRIAAILAPHCPDVAKALEVHDE